MPSVRYFPRIITLKKVIGRLNEARNVAIRREHISILHLINFAGPCTATNIRHCLPAPVKATIAKINELLRVGYIQLTTPFQQRYKRYTLTVAGLEYIQALEKALVNYQPPNAWRTLRTKNRNGK